MGGEAQGRGPHDDPLAIPQSFAAGDAFRELFRRSRRAMMLVDDERRYVAANESACRLLGTTAQQITRRTIADFTPEDTRGQVPAMWEHFLSEGTLEGPYELIRPDGRRIRVTYSATANITPGVHLSILSPVENLERPTVMGSVQRIGTPISPRQLEVLRLVALGGSNQEVASQLGISSETVRNHIRNTREKLGAKTKSHAIALAFQRSLF